MRLDVRRPGAATGLDDVGVQRALHEELDRFALGFGLCDQIELHLLEGADELAPDDLALLLRVADTLQMTEEGIGSIHGDQTHAGGGDVVLLDLLALALAEQSVIDEHGGELVADRLVHERRGDGGVDAAGESRDDAGRADLLANARDLLVDDVATVPVGGEAGSPVQEVLEDLLSVVGVLHFWVPLHAVEALLVVAECRDGGVGGGCQDVEALGRASDLVAVAHPDVLRVRLAAEEHTAIVRDDGVGGTVFAQAGVRDLAAKGTRHHLEAVADAESGNAEIEDVAIERRRPRFVDRRGTAGEDERHRVLLGDVGSADRVGHDLAVHACLADPAGDELRVLRAEVDDEHGALDGVCAHRAAS